MELSLFYKVFNWRAVSLKWYAFMNLMANLLRKGYYKNYVIHMELIQTQCIIILSDVLLLKYFVSEDIKTFLAIY